MLDRPLEDRGPQLVLRKIGVEKQPVVANLVPLTVQPPLADSVVKAGSREWVGNRVADIVEGQAAREVDAADQRVGGLPDVSDHEESGRLDPGRDACLDG